jgi:hypothetical protein
MSTLKTNNVQVGQSVTATNNFTLYQPTVPDGTVRLGVGNSGATTADVLVANSSSQVMVGTATPSTGAALTVNGSIKGTITSDTVKASTSGTFIDFTGIPSWVKRITVAMQTVSTNGSSNYLIRIGNTTVTSSGYASVMNYVNPGANSCTGSADSTGFLLTKDINSGTAFTAIATIVLQTSGFYVSTFVGNNGVNGAGFFGSGLLNLGSTLDRVRITTVNGTDTFDAGTINILYEG